MRHFILFIILATVIPYSQAQNYKLTSPDGKLTLELARTNEGLLSYSFNAGGQTLINRSELGFQTEADRKPAAGRWVVKEVGRRTVDEVWNPVWGKRKIVPERFSEISLLLTAKGSASIKTMQIIARAYNDGVAFRYLIPSGQKIPANSSIEQTEFNFAEDYTAWFYNGENPNIGPKRLTECDGQYRPVMTVKANGHYMAIHEADLRSGIPLVLSTKSGETRFSVMPAKEKLAPGYVSAWRVILCGEKPGALVDSHLIELLNPQPKAGYDFSWVQPGIAVWDWRINGAITDDGFTYSMSYPSWVRMIDFAAEQGFSYLVLDADWYGPEHEAGSNPLSGDKSADVRKIIRYGKEKGVGVWLYLNDVGGRKYPIEETLKQYGEWGAAGVKYGFMKGSAEEKNKWTQKITELCAQNKLLVDFHDNPVHPYGQLRTWPNAITREFCHAQLDGHHVFLPSTFVTSVFVNMVAGPLDMNNGMFDLRQGPTTRVDENQPVPSTLVAEAARTLIVFSGATILPDIPEYYRKYPDLLRFLSAQKMPWVESRTLAGEIGKYIVMMRQTEDAVLLAAATNESGRTIDLPLDFLDGGKLYDATIIEDGEDAHYLTNRETLKVTRSQVEKTGRLHLKLAPGGGACVILRMAKEDLRKVHLQPRGSLLNSKIKFEREKKGRVAFLGGSITEMKGWREMICEELQRRFPDTEFDFINAGISSTGTTPAAFRFQRDVLRNGPVDLLFEEAAVNDETNHFNGEEQIRGMEGVIRQARLSNPETDIILLHFIWDGMLTPLEQGIIPQVILNHEKVAEYYQVPSINLALELSQRMQAGEFDWQVFGGTHPAPFGHKIYAASIKRLFDTMWKEIPSDVSDKKKPHTLPGKPMDEFSYFKGKLVDIREAGLGKGWKYKNRWQPKVKADTRKGFVDVPVIEALKPGSQLTFSFRGKAVGIFHVAGPDAGIIEYSIDGKPFKQKDLFTEWSSHLYLPWVTMLEPTLAEGDHELVIRLSKERNPSSMGTACHIVYFTVNE